MGLGRSHNMLVLLEKYPRLIVRETYLATRELCDKGKLPYVLKDLCGACGVASTALADILRDAGYATDVVQGYFVGRGHSEYHLWVVLQERWIIDITAEQFEQPPIVVRHAPHRDYDPCCIVTHQKPQERVSAISAAALRRLQDLGVYGRHFERYSGTSGASGAARSAHAVGVPSATAGE